MKRRLFLNILGLGAAGLATQKYWFMAPDPLNEVSLPIPQHTFCWRYPMTIDVYDCTITDIDYETRCVTFESSKPRSGEQVGSMYEKQASGLYLLSPGNSRPRVLRTKWPT